MEEIWRDIEKSNSLYQVSNMARIKSFMKGPPRILKAIKNSSGYHEVFILIDGERVHRLIHRLVAMAFIENPHNMPIINHIDGNILNNLPENLEWCDQKHNMKEAVKLRGKWHFKTITTEQRSINSKLALRKRWHGY